MFRILEVIYRIDESIKLMTGTLGALVCSVILSIIAGRITSKSNKVIISKVMYVIAALCFVMILALCGISYYVNTEYTRVPNVVGEKLREAREDIREAGLNHSFDGTGSDESIVTGQDPEAGTFLKKKETVELDIEGGESTENGLETLWEAYSECEQVNLQLSIYELACILDEELIGYPISSLEGARIYLYETSTDSYVRDYIIDGNQVTFENLPAGAYFWVTVELDGYDKYNERIQISSSKGLGDDKTNSQPVYLQGKDKTTTSVIGVQIQNNSSYDFDDLVISFRLIGVDTIFGECSCDSHGVVDCSIYYYSDMELEVLVQKYGSGIIDSCVVKLETLEVGDTYTAAWIRINEDDTCEAIDSPYH